MNANSILSLFFVWSVLSLGSIAYANLGGSELVNSASSTSQNSSSNIASQFASYEACKSLGNSPAECREATDRGVRYTLPTQETDRPRGQRLQLSEAVKDCVRNHALRAGDQLGLEVSNQLFRMQNLGNPNSFAFRAIQQYYTLCTEGT